MEYVLILVGPLNNKKISPDVLNPPSFEESSRVCSSPDFFINKIN